MGVASKNLEPSTSHPPPAQQMKPYTHARAHAHTQQISPIMYTCILGRNPDIIIIGCGCWTTTHVEIWEQESLHMPPTGTHTHPNPMPLPLHLTWPASSTQGTSLTLPSPLLSSTDPSPLRVCLHNYMFNSICNCSSRAWNYIHS